MSQRRFEQPLNSMAQSPDCPKQLDFQVILIRAKEEVALAMNAHETGPKRLGGTAGLCR